MDNKNDTTTYTAPYPATNMAAFPPQPPPPYGYPPASDGSYPPMAGYAYPPQAGYPQQPYPQPAMPPPSYNNAVWSGGYAPKPEPHGGSPSAYTGVVDYEGVISFTDKSVRLGK